MSDYLTSPEAVLRLARSCSIGIVQYYRCLAVICHIVVTLKFYINNTNGTSCAIRDGLFVSIFYNVRDHSLNTEQRCRYYSDLDDVFTGCVMLASDMLGSILIGGAIGAWFIDNREVTMMDDFDYVIEPTKPMKLKEFDIDLEVPEPIDQWAVEDFDQFSALIADAE